MDIPQNLAASDACMLVPSSAQVRVVYTRPSDSCYLELVRTRFQSLGFHLQP